MMYGLDISVSLLIVLGGIYSYFRGLSREVMSTLGLLAIFICAMWGAAMGQLYIGSIFASPRWSQIVLGVVLFLAAVGVYILWENLLARLVYGSRLSIIDRALGLLFGMFKVGVALAALLIILMQAAPERVANLAAHAAVAPPLFRMAIVITAALPGQTRHEVQRAYDRIGPPPDKRADRPAPGAQTPEPSPDDRALRQIIRKHAKEP
jgi:membrane protein required for colicin V production